MDMEIVEHSECIANDWKSNDLKKVDCCNFCGHPKPSHSKECPISVADLQAQLDAVTKERDELKAKLDILAPELRALYHDWMDNIPLTLVEAIEQTLAVETTLREVPKP